MGLDSEGIAQRLNISLRTERNSGQELPRSKALSVRHYEEVAITPERRRSLRRALTGAGPELVYFIELRQDELRRTPLMKLSDN